ncbi:MAG: TAXI family TRAP transporter solute-binding subunit [Rhizobiaceae bacterium]|nr:TAXI family TRAP transporter solute-binding subunit [Rhizobiaceae bacterium]
MKQITKTLAGGIVAGVLLAGAITGASAQDDIRIGAMREGTSWYVFAATLEQMLEPELEGAGVEVIARGGGVANPMVVQNGDAEIALSNVATAVWAHNGHDMYEGASAPDIRALVGGLNTVHVGVMVRNDYIGSRGTDNLAELLGGDVPVRVIYKPTGSSAVPAAHMIMESVGTSPDAIKANGGEIIQVATPQIPEVIRDGKADLYIDTIIKGHPTITEVSLTGDVTFVDLPQETLDLLAKNGLKPGEYGPWFDGQSGANTGADLGTVLIAHKDLDEETAYQITKTLIENAEKLGEAHAAWANFDPEQAFKSENLGIPLHSGAERYYKERGWM